MKIRILDHGNKAAAELLWHSIAERIPLETDGDLGPLYELCIEPELSVPGSFRVGGRSCQIRISAADEAGLIFGIGKLLRTGIWQEDWFTPVPDNADCLPENLRRAVTVSSAELKYRDGRPDEDSAGLLTALAFFGCNTVVLARPSVPAPGSPEEAEDSTLAESLGSLGLSLEEIVSDDPAVSGEVSAAARTLLEIDRVRYLAGLWNKSGIPETFFLEYCNLFFAPFLADEIAKIASFAADGRIGEAKRLIDDTALLLPERVRCGLRWRSLTQDM